MKKSIQSFMHTIILVLILGSTAFGQFKLPSYEVVSLDNGLTVYLMEKKDVPLISFSAVFDGGVIKDGSTSGIASFTAEALRFGTTNYSKSQIDSLFNFYGSNVSTYASADYSGLYTQFMMENTGTILSVVKEIILSPTFPDEEIQKRKQRWIAEIDQAKESPKSVIGSYFNKDIFGDAPYGNPARGTKAGIESISLEKVKEFYNYNYFPKSSAIAVVGDFNASDMIKIIERHFSEWKKASSEVTIHLDMTYKPFESPSVYLINKDKATETTFMIGGYGITKINPDQIQLDVINTILGGRFTSWLNDELRLNAGLTYGARSRFSQYKFSGTFYISTFTATKNTEAAIDLALKTYDRLFENGIDEETLSSAKNYVKGQFPPDYETAGALAGFLTQKYVYGLDDSIINSFEDEVNGLTVEKASELINKYFPKTNLQFVLIGKAEDIRDKVAKYGMVTEKSIDEDSY
jgi:zinc protease